MTANELAELVKQKIHNLRPKLLDLSKRNPLVATRFSSRSNSYVRVVDELPEALYEKLTTGQKMRLVSLPAIEDDPRDEQTPVFQTALINARLTDEQYISKINTIDPNADDDVDIKREIERALKDRVRKALGMPPRADKTATNLIDHAKINGIAPSYELPQPGAGQADGRHADNDIQTLLLPTDFDRKLNAISSKCRTWMQETGINVLHVAYGFLEWSDGTQAERSFSPLILCEARLEKRRTAQGIEFSIAGSGDEPAINAVLAEKLRREFGVELPIFGGCSLEKYFAVVGKLNPPNMTLRVRRQVAIGVFPSARLAMYNDLDPDQADFPDNKIVESLLAGRNTDSVSPFADEYEVDHPDIESRVPCLVMDADSSQFSALVDVASGKNIAVEGPPGTGKSQTIVNIIAAALGEGKKVLFVAEKLAALNVVKSRLEAIGLKEFLLPLQAERSTREQVISSLRERLAMHGSPGGGDYDSKLQEYRRTRQQIAGYIDLMKRPFAASGLTVHEIIGKGIATGEILKGIAKEVLEKCNVPASSLTEAGLESLRNLATRLAEANQEASAAQPFWRATKLVHPDRFTVDDACDLAGRASRAAGAVADARENLVAIGVDDNGVTLSEIDDQLAQAARHIDAHGSDLLISLLHDQNAETVQRFIERCEACDRKGQKLSPVLAAKPDAESLRLIERIAQICERFSLTAIDPDTLSEGLRTKRELKEAARTTSRAIAPLVARRPESGGWYLADIARAHTLIQETGRDALHSRNPRTHAHDAHTVLEQLCTEGRRLQAQKVELAQKVSFAVEISLEALCDALLVLRAAGRFSFFSPKYRRARHLFLTISRAPGYRKQDAVDTLEALIQFRRRDAEFNRRPDGAALLGHEFRGLETDLEKIERLADFYRCVEEEFGSPGKRDLRVFLREGDVAELGLIPEIPRIKAAITHDQITERIAKLRQEIRNLEEAHRRLAPCVHVLADPKSVQPHELGRILEQIRTLVIEREALDRCQEAQDILGSAFNGSRTRDTSLKAFVSWAIATQALGRRLLGIVVADKMEHARNVIGAVRNAERSAQELLSQLSATAKIEVCDLTEVWSSWRDLAERLESMAQDPDGLIKHSVLAAALREVRTHGLGALVEEPLRQGANFEGLADQFEAVAARQLVKAVYASEGAELSKYPRSKLDDLRAALARQDREVIELSRVQLRGRVAAGGKPPNGNGVGAKSTWTDMALIQNEISKKQRFISVRDLTQRAGRALLELKPCWMMSPLAVAQYVPKAAVHFDLCIIDEASQMPPESAIGALLRCDQTVVVGDTNQLPPSSFFRTLIDDDEADEDEAVLHESILEMANATFRPARRLRWHYRSRHSGLIKFSNRMIYGDDLVVFPSATELGVERGVELRPLPGRYSAGTNPIEAKAMVEAALEAMRTEPDRSLGIVTLNQKQRDLITEELEYAIGTDPQALAYIEAWKERNGGLDEFFIKNLENVQGDERDVIFIGTVYGPQEDGMPVMQRFGPINGIAGKRRLNVLFTRARQKIVTFSSMKPTDITADGSKNAGAYMLKRWLEYSATGVLEGGVVTEREPDSDFERFVISQIRSMGYEAVPQVGAAGYFIDIGVRHPDWVYGFILGVECDGAQYHSAKSARDRDRLRQEVLEGLGWRLHRIWSTDWFNNPGREAERLREIIALRLAELKGMEIGDRRPVADEAIGSQSPAAPAGDIAAQPAQEEIQRPQTTGANASRTPEDRGRGIAVGDTVRMKFLTDDRRTIQITISTAASDPSRGIVHHQAPTAQAVLGAQVGDEIEVLVGSYVRRAVVEDIIKGPA